MAVKYCYLLHNALLLSNKALKSPFRRVKRWQHFCEIVPPNVTVFLEAMGESVIEEKSGNTKKLITPLMEKEVVGQAVNFMFLCMNITI